VERAKPAVPDSAAPGDEAVTGAAADVGSANRGHNSKNSDPTGDGCCATEHRAQHTAEWRPMPHLSASPPADTAALPRDAWSRTGSAQTRGCTMGAAPQQTCSFNVSWRTPPIESATVQGWKGAMATRPILTRGSPPPNCTTCAGRASRPASCRSSCPSGEGKPSACCDG